MTGGRRPVWLPRQASTVDRRAGWRDAREARVPSRAPRRGVRRLAAVAGSAVAVAILVAAGILATRAASPADLGPAYDPTTLAGLELGGPPWPPEMAHLQARLVAMGLPVVTADAEAIHTHEHLDLLVDGKALAIPADIGINTAAGLLAPTHTRDTSGIIHVESPLVRGFTLGRFFDVWGIALDDDCVGIQCDGAGRLQYTWVNGQPYAGNARDIVFAAHQQIVIAVGTPAQMPSPVAASYAFPAGI